VLLLLLLVLKVLLEESQSIRPGATLLGRELGETLELRQEVEEAVWALETTASADLLLLLLLDQM
jgi:hypothetical protein